MLKVELHAHTDEDPADLIPHSTTQLIEHASRLEYSAIAVTLHDRYFDPAPHQRYARSRGILLLSGIERTIAHRHLLLINFPAEVERVRNFDDLADLKARSAGLVVAPHPFYPTLSAMRGLLETHAALVDAVEVNAMYTRAVNFNRQAIGWARARGKPMVGNTDLHLLDQMGTTYSLVDAEPEANALCEAIRRGRVEVRTSPLTVARAGWIFARMLVGGARGRMRTAPGVGARR